MEKGKENAMNTVWTEKGLKDRIKNAKATLNNFQDREINFRQEMTANQIVIYCDETISLCEELLKYKFGKKKRGTTKGRKRKVRKDGRKAC